MPDDDTTIDYRYDLLDRISVGLYNADYVSKTSVHIIYMRSHLITADAGSAYIFRCVSRGFLSDQAKYTAIGGLHPVETLQGRRRSAMACISIHFMIDV